MVLLVTHDEKFITSRGQKFTVMCSVEKMGYFYYCQAEINNKAGEGHVFEEVFERRDYAINYINLVLGEFDPFTLKILTFDEDYPKEVKEECVKVWRNEGVKIQDLE